MSNSKNKSKINLKSLTRLITALRRFSWLILILFFIILYGFMLFKISNFTNAQPSQASVNNDLQTTTQPTINPKLINKIEQLKNNSVSVRALFNQNRQNPF